MKLSRIILLAAIVVACVTAGPRAADEDASKAAVPRHGSPRSGRRFRAPGTPTARARQDHVESRPGQVCWTLSVGGIAAATAGTSTGRCRACRPVVVGLTPPTEGTSKGGADADRGLIKGDPSGSQAFYVNVHQRRVPRRKQSAGNSGGDQGAGRHGRDSPKLSFTQSLLDACARVADQVVEPFCARLRHVVSSRRGRSAPDQRSPAVP